MRTGLVVSAALAGVGLTACGYTGAANLAFMDVNPPQPKIGDVVTVRFSATDLRGVPLAGANVNFSLLSPLSDGGVVGVTLNPTTNQTNKGDGTVETQLVASSRVNAVIVVATSGDKTAVSPPITFAGAYPSARNFTFQCGQVAGDSSGGIHAIRTYDQSRTMIEGIKLQCTAHVGDRNGNGLSGVEVSFFAEAGTIAPTQTSVTDVDGNATILYKSSFPLPQDVSPSKFQWAGAWPGGVMDSSHIGDSNHALDFIAPLWMHPYEWVADPVQNYAAMFPSSDNRTEPNRADPIRPNLTLNSRDNLVTMIAVTAGEEAFQDDTGSGQFDPAHDQFIDSTEPFVDSNDNGTWDPGEIFIDTNGNGVWDGKNNVFDAATLIWAKEKILWTGVYAFPEDLQAPQPVVIVIGNTGLVVQHCNEAGPITVTYSDPWYNSPTQDVASDGCQLGASSTGLSMGMFKPLVVSDPGQFGQGIYNDFTYPAATQVTFKVADAHDCSSTLGGCGMIDCPFSPPVSFNVPVACTQTSSPIAGDVLSLIMPGAIGLVY